MGVVRAVGGKLGTVGLSNSQLVNGSLRLNTNFYLSRTPGSAGNRQTWTWSAWVKRSSLNTGNRQTLFSASGAGNNTDYFALGFDASAGSGKLFCTQWTVIDESTAVFRDCSAWYHIVLNYNGSNMVAYVNGTSILTIAKTGNLAINSTFEHGIGRDVSFGRYFDGCLTNVYLIDGQQLDPSYFGFTDPLTNTWRPKRFKPTGPNNGTTWSNGSVTTGTNKGDITQIFDGSPGGTGAAPLGVWTDTGAQLTYTFPSTINYNSTVEVYAFKKDTRPSNVIYIALGTSLSGATNYVNSVTTTGSWVTIASGSGSFSAISYQDQGDVGGYDGVRVDGIELLDSDTTNMGKNAFYLPFDTDGAGTIGIGTDRSGRGNNWTINNFVTTAAGIQTNPNITPDSPSGISFSTAPTAGIGTTTGMTKPNNYCTLNPLRCTGTSPTQGGESTLPVFSENNLTVQNTQNATWKNAGATIDIPSGVGKWYWEAQPVVISGPDGIMVGVASEGFEWNRDTYYTGLPWIGSATGTSWSVFSVNGQKYTNGSGSGYISGSYGINDTIGVALNAEATTLTFYLNGASQGIAFTGVTAGSNKFLQIGTSVHGGSQSKIRFNFGQKPFKYAPPAGHLPVCTANLPKPPIVRPDQYVGVTTYTGTGAARSLTTGFKPDLVWVKQRNGTQNNILCDSVRGANNYLVSDLTQGENTSTTITSFDSNGFSVGSGGATGGSGSTYVAWAWKAGGNSNTYNINDVGYATTTAAGLTAGTIALTGASVNTKSGFSIIRYTTPSSASSFSVPHGLTQKPNFAIFKGTGSGGSWIVWHDFMNTSANNGYLLLNTTDSFATQSQTWNNTDPTSSVFNFGTTAWWGSSNEFIGYVWHNVSGFSKFGSYVVNASGDANPTHFIYTGFRPAWLLIKKLASGTNWILRDNKRGAYNPVNASLAPNATTAEASIGDIPVDFTSNGFVLRDTSSVQNGPSGTTATYVYAAFAEAPTQNLYGGQSNAR